MMTINVLFGIFIHNLFILNYIYLQVLENTKIYYNKIMKQTLKKILHFIVENYKEGANMMYGHYYDQKYNKR